MSVHCKIIHPQISIAMTKSKFLLLSFSGILFFIFFDCASNLTHSNAGGAPSGRTGSPGDGSTTCAVSGCHTGSTVVAEPSGWINSDIPVWGYEPDSTYTITATATTPGCMKFGFEMCSEKSGGTKVGTWTIINSGATKLVGSSKYVTHVSGGTTGSSPKTWTVKWKAPSSGNGPVTFYGAFNLANNNGGDGGDVIHTSTLTVHQQVAGVFEKENHDMRFFVSPNPVRDFFTLNYEVKSTSTLEITAFDISGKRVETFYEGEKSPGTFSESFSLGDNFSSGIYFLTVKSNESTAIQKIVVQK